MSIAIYVEGGGQGNSGRAMLRQGFDAFLARVKQEAIERSWRWRLICWGGRDATFHRFRSAIRDREADVVMLVVDAEGPLNNAVLEHLQRRDGWDLGFANEDMIHLMVQTMETWIVADPDALTDHYGQGFRQSALPKNVDIESVPKSDVERALKSATRTTQKGEYHKIRHASDLLKRIDPDRVRDRCPACTRLFAAFDTLFAANWAE